MDISKTQEELAQKGFTRLHNLIPLEFIKRIQELIELDSSNLTHDFPSFLKRFSYDLSEDIQKEVFLLLKVTQVGQLICQLTQRNLFLSQEIYFELQKNVSRGFPWHVGTYSFGLHQTGDFGCSLWIPFVPIHAEKGGGVSCVPKNFMSGKFVYENIEPAVLSEINRRIMNGENLTYTNYLDLKNRPLNTGYLQELLDAQGVSCNFQLGDALLFDKYVIHRSDKIQEGGPDYRGALVLRFIDKESTFSQVNDQMRHFPVTKFGSLPYTEKKSDSLKEGQNLLTSGYFENLEARCFDKL